MPTHINICCGFTRKYKRGFQCGKSPSIDRRTIEFSKRSYSNNSSILGMNNIYFKGCINKNKEKMIQFPLGGKKTNQMYPTS